MPLPPSLLKEVIQQLPDSWRMKKDAVPGYLAKRGVKPEELEYSGLQQGLKSVESDRLTKQDLLSLEGNRPDIQHSSKFKDAAASYAETTLPGTKPETYGLSIRHFETLEDSEKRQVQSHFSQAAPDYLWHTRTSEDVIDGKNTRIVQEIQSDLHQQGRTKGYKTPEDEVKHLQLTQEFSDKKTALESLDLSPGQRQELRGELNSLAMRIRAMRAGETVPDAPFKTSWSRKAIEQEILDASATGKDAIAIPLKGLEVDSLNRSPGVQKWYETQIRSTMKKVAKAMGGEYKETSSYMSKRMPEDFEGPAPARTLVEYGQIILPEDKTKLGNLKLYSAGGAEALLISQSLSEGAQPDELKQFLVEQQGMSNEDANAGVDRAVKLMMSSAKARGASDEDLVEFLATEQGYNPEYITSLLTQKDESVAAKESIDEPAVEEEPTTWMDKVKSIASSFVMDEDSLISPIDVMSQMVTGQLLPDTTEQQAAKVANIYTKYSTMPNSMQVWLGYGSEEDKAKAAQDVVDLNTFVVNNLQKDGINTQLDPTTGDIWIQTDTGDWEVLESSAWDTLATSRGEILGGMATGMAASAGLKAATEASRAPGSPLVRTAAAAGAFAFTAAGGAIGAVLGRGEDITRNALETKEKIDSQLMWDQLKDAGAADVVFSAVGTSLVKLGVVGAKTTYRAWDLLLQGNKEGAYSALKELMHLDDTQVDEIIKGWENIAGRKAPGLTRASKALEIIPRTTPGGEAIVQPAAAMDPIASANAAKEIDLRAKQLLSQADTAAGDNVSTILRDEMVGYKDRVKQVYSGVKEFGIQEMADTGYTFDYSKLAIDPILKRTTEELTNPALRERALNYMQRIRQLGGVVEEVVTPVVKEVEEVRKFRRSGPETIKRTVEGEAVTKELKPTLRSFEDLLELRRVFNEFSSSKLIKNAKDIQLVKDIRGKIDGEITRTAQKHMDQPDDWLKAWKEARTEYGKMFDLEANVLYKQIMRKGTTDKLVARQLMNRAMATDNTFREVIEKLPPKIRALTENSVMQEFVEKFTVGEAGGMRATNFPQLAEQLNQIPFTSEKAQNLKRVVTQMAEVFKNDVDLARATGTIRTPQFQSYLTTDPIIRAKYEIASTVFNYIKRVLPGRKADAIALVMQTSRVLEKPRNVQALETLIKSLPEDPSLRNTLKAAQLEIAKFGERSEFPKVPIYRQATPGKTLASSKGPLGEGIYFSTTKQTRQEGMKTSSRNVLPDRIANEENIAATLGVEKVTPKLIRENPQLQEVLKDKGYQGLSIGNQVLIFK